MGAACPRRWHFLSPAALQWGPDGDGFFIFFSLALPNYATICAVLFK